MQALLLESLGWILLIIGVILVLMAVVSAFNEDQDHETQTQSMGVILLGPIPIVWGYGKKGWMIAGVVGVILCIVWLILFLE